MLDTIGIERAIAASGFAPRGFVYLDESERVGELLGRRSLVLIGFAGGRQWAGFARSSEASDGCPDPLDRWSKRIIDALARDLGGKALYPFGTSPYWPFQQWAKRAEPLSASPLGLLIHPVYGLWHSYRGALAFADAPKDRLAPTGPNPCGSCTDKPCLSACPVSAFRPGDYDVAACTRWLHGGTGATCMEGGCLARRACPVGQDFAHSAEQARFSMKAFLGSR